MNTFEIFFKRTIMALCVIKISLWYLYKKNASVFPQKMCNMNIIIVIFIIKQPKMKATKHSFRRYALVCSFSSISKILHIIKCEKQMLYPNM